MVRASIEPPAAALRWAADVVGASRVTVGERLLGGSHAITHVIRATEPPAEMVMRRFPPGDDAALREAHVLGALDGLGGFAPRLLAADITGVKFGEPAVLISRMAGSANLHPDDVGTWVQSLAQALARVHSHTHPQLPTLLERLPVTPPAQRLAGPAAGVVTSAWEQLHSHDAVVTHFDFWSGNTLWTGDSVTGIVDWSGACRGPRGFDVGWCRLDLALLHGEEQAGQFLDAYDAAAGTKLARVALWDLYACARSHLDVVNWSESYRQLGRIDLTSTVLRKRHDRWTRAALEALNQA